MNRFTPNHKVPLTKTGVEQARAGGLVLRDFIEQRSFEEECKSQHPNPRSILFFTSPYLRARQTCQNIIEGIKDVPGISYHVCEEARMREQDFGNFQSTTEEMEKIWEERAHYGHFFYRIPHGESAADVYDRIASFNESLFRQFEKANFPNILVLVTHGIWAQVFLMKWFRWSYEQFESLRNIPHCQYLIMKRSRDTDKFVLKTPLRTWDDISDDDDATKEIRDEVCFHAKYKVSDPRDLDIAGIIRAQKEAFKSILSKERKIKLAFNAIHNGLNDLLTADLRESTDTESAGSTGI